MDDADGISIAVRYSRSISSGDHITRLCSSANPELHVVPTGRSVLSNPELPFDSLSNGGPTSMI